ncbi:pilin [Enterovibrio coralii]|uniref:Pilus assembly protein PilA n=1 Tax=Enterovibrio coralii TaxID=294935 RepID=A0A135I3S9_9GAMM|nr:prepilin-type N-terminal cleavage/methylation domain-containing protein [Enterovibrio coralii]KXF80088.1 hypothetical protein ATN88_13810 [Enterovibrio coralii]
MKKQKGFSLIELLIVVGIIGALTAIAVPAYSNYKNKADVTAGIASLKNMLTKADLFLELSSTNTLATFITAGADVGGLDSANGFVVEGIGTITGTAASESADGTLVLALNTDTAYNNQTITYTRSEAAWTCAMSAGIQLDGIKGCATTTP